MSHLSENRWRIGNASVAVSAGVHEEGEPMVLLVITPDLRSGFRAGEPFTVVLGAPEIGVLQAGIESAFAEAIEMARGEHPDVPS